MGWEEADRSRRGVRPRSSHSRVEGRRGVEGGKRRGGKGEASSESSIPLLCVVSFFGFAFVFLSSPSLSVSVFRTSSQWDISSPERCPTAKIDSFHQSNPQRTLLSSSFVRSHSKLGKAFSADSVSSHPPSRVMLSPFEYSLALEARKRMIPPKFSGKLGRSKEKRRERDASGQFEFATRKRAGRRRSTHEQGCLARCSCRRGSKRCPRGIH